MSGSGETPQTGQPSQPAQAPRRGGRYPQTALALTGAILGCLVIVAFIVLVVVRPDNAAPNRVDWREVVAESSDDRLIAPDLPEGWTANYAELRSDDGVEVWAIGFLSPTRGFVGMNLAFEATDVWLQSQTGGSEESVSIDGVDWTVVDRRDDDQAGNRAFSLVTTPDGNDARAVVLYGTADDTDFRTVAGAVADEIGAR